MGIGNIANTGMRAAMTEMEVISNNIANASTPGFKRSYINFADVYPGGSGGSQAAGLGVQVSSIRQDFGTGGTNFTGKPLDLLISGKGFFITNDANSGLTSYTRAGGFTLDDNGFIVNSARQILQGYQASDGVISAGSSVTDLQISYAPRPATPTSAHTVNANLDSNSPSISATFDKNDTTTYTYTGGGTLIDSLGNSHTMQLYYVKTAADNTWTVYSYVDGASAASDATVVFTANGTLSTVNGTAGASIPLSIALTNGATTPQAVALSLTGTTQVSGANSIRSSGGNGYSVGSVNGYSVDGDGRIYVSYNNGENVLMGKVAIATFQSPEGLANIGNQSWITTGDSGDPNVNVANSDSNIRSSSVEASNVDLTQEMINLIGAQHNFQANARVEQTYNEVMQTITQL